MSFVPMSARAAHHTLYDAVVVGAGFAGIYMLYKLHQLKLRAVGIEAAPDVGGTWYWNRYPGARCDVESLLYCYTFSPEIDAEWVWSERYATQPEILRYLRFAADKLDVRRHIRFSERVNQATWSDANACWTVLTNQSACVRARFCIMASGSLSASRPPDIPGIDDFRGQHYYTSSWPDDVDLNGKRVAVIGTGSSGIQAVPRIAAVARHTTVFQRTPNFTVPAMNAPLSQAQIAEFRDNAVDLRERARRGEITGSGDLMISPELRATRAQSAFDFTAQQRREIFERRWSSGGALLPGSFRDLMIDESANSEAAEFAREKIALVVKDPVVAKRLTPIGYPFGAKRLCVDTDYYATYNNADVELVDITADPIETILPDGIATRDRKFKVDVIVFATGFDAVTGALLSIDIRGREGVSLADSWAAGPRSYLGLCIAGFPNLFAITGPGSPSVLSNVVVSIEQHVEFIADCLRHMQQHELSVVEPRPDAQERWVAHVSEVASGTLFVKANSWYLGANIPGKPRVFLAYLGGVGKYRQICTEVAQKQFEGFEFTAASQAAAVPNDAGGIDLEIGQ